MTDKAHFAIIAGELAPGARVTDEQFSKIPDLDVEMKKYISTDTGVFRVTSEGEVGGVTKTIRCIVEFKSGKFSYLRWWEED